MLRHYLATALRHFVRFRLATLVNVSCLALGLACLTVTYAVITFISKSDAYFPKADRIQIVSIDLDAPAAGRRFLGMPLTGPAIAGLLRTDFPQLEAVARRTQGRPVAVSTGDSSTFAPIEYADPELLDIFDFKFVAGPGAASLRSPHSALITEQAAERVFGARDVLGRRLRIDNREEVTITGVIAKIPEPTRFGFEILVSMDVHEAIRRAAGAPPVSAGEFADWMWLRDSYFTYVLLPQNGSLDAREFAAQLESFTSRHVPVHGGGNTLELGTMPVGSLFINMMNTQLGAFTGMALSVPAMFYVLASLVLLIACLNYANLASAMATVRDKEVGLRKVLGAARRQVLGQHLLEAALIGFAALVLTLLFVALMVPLVARLGFDIGAAVLLQPQFAGFLILLLVAVTIAGGLYPAMVLSSIRPTHALRSGSARGGRRFAPALLVVTQFAASSFLLILVLVMQAQNGASLRLGQALTEDPLVALRTSLSTAGIDMATLRDRLVASPLIKSVTASDSVPVRWTANPLPLSASPEVAARPVTASINNVHYDFFSTLGIDVLAGRDFAPDRGEDINRSWDEGRQTHVIVGAGLAAQLGWTTPAQAVGQTIYFRWDTNAFPMRIIGVAEEKPLHVIGMGANSSIYFLTPPNATYVTARISKDDIAGALAHIDAVWKELSPHVPSTRRFLDELFEESYRPLATLGTLMGALAALGCAIATVGLFGMAIYVTGRRTHEIGVRKTLGARTARVFAMLLRDFSKPVVVANLIAWPLAFVTARIYLTMFANRISLTVEPFAAAFLVTLLIAWLAVGSRAYRAASASPAAVLRYE